MTFVDPFGLRGTVQNVKMPRLDQTENVMGTFVSKEAKERIDPLSNELKQAAKQFAIDGNYEKYSETANRINGDIDAIIADDWEQNTKEPFVILDIMQINQGDKVACWACSRLAVYYYYHGISEADVSGEQVEQDLMRLIERHQVTLNGAGYASKTKVITNNIPLSIKNSLLRKDPIYIDYQNPNMSIGHIATVKGYREINGKPYFMVMNSWGEDYSGKWIGLNELLSVQSGDDVYTFTNLYATIKNDTL